ncbi:hypothetical protein SEA_NIKE_101 [Microbacterium phage Nike]|nr:hypothetical protein SEA_NIKE_101 [Microbacterium phage Nike]
MPDIEPHHVAADADHTVVPDGPDPSNCLCGLAVYYTDAGELRHGFA